VVTSGQVFPGPFQCHADFPVVTIAFGQQLNIDSVMQQGTVQQSFMNFTYKSMHENSARS
jgi:hypothetical protein